MARATDMSSPTRTWNIAGQKVLICSMKHAASQFMYLPITRTLEQGFRNLGASEVTLTSGHGPARRAAMLNAGDVIVWVGAGRGVEMLPLAALGKRGIHRVLYGTEPMSDRCDLGSANNVHHGITQWDEIWHYTMHNANLCASDQLASKRFVHRYVPPGALGADLFASPSLTSATATSSSASYRSPALLAGAKVGRRAQAGAKAVFLGIIPRNNTPNMPGYARRACFSALSRELGSKLAHRENVFGLAEMRRLVRSHVVFVNLHKDCGESDRPAEAVRFSLLLTAGARIVSERADPADERMFAGLVNFVGLTQLPGAVATALAEQTAEPEDAAARRVEEFHRRFSPASIFARAGLSRGGNQASLESSSTNEIGSTPCHYEPGVVEQEWLGGAAFGNICAISRRASQLNGLRMSLAFARSSWSATARLPTAEEQPMLSKLVCDGGKRIEYLEPLTGIARHPLAKVGCGLPSETGIFDISHLVLANRCNREPPRPQKNLLYDLGCSTYSKIPLCELHPKHRRCVNQGRASPPPPSPPPASSESLAAVAHGPSLPLFIELYRRNCIAFDRIYAWEAARYDPKLWWRDVPSDVRSKLEFHNVPVDENSVDENVSFLKKLKATAKPEDFVALKVDIDGGPELAIVEAIADSAELAALIDEIFFEYHFYFDGLVGPGWLIRRPGVSSGRRRRRFEIETNATVDDALGLMAKLRKRGIRSHFWV